MTMRKFIVIFSILLTLTSALDAADNVGILKAQYEKPGVAESFKVGSNWYPYPAYSDRDAWDKLLNKDAKKTFIKEAEKVLGYQWQYVPASTFLALNTTGDKQAMRDIERANRKAFIALMMGELAEGKGRFLMDLADGFWFYGTSYHWHHSNQTYGQLPRYEMEMVGLGSVRHAATIPIAYHFFHEEMDKLDKRINIVVEEAVKRIIIDPAMEGYGTDKFIWMGPTVNGRKGNWNPWCNHGCLLAMLLMEKDQERLNAAIKASIEDVDVYLATYFPDGACEEGIGYWGQSVGRFCEYLQLLYDASGGKFDVFKNEFVMKMAEYPSRVHGGLNSKSRLMKANFGDGNATGGSAAMLYYKVGSLFGHNELKDFAVFQTANLTRGKFTYPNVLFEEGYCQLENVRYYRQFCDELDKLNQRIKEGSSIDMILEELRGDVPHATWYSYTQQAMLRTGDNWFVGAKAGHNGEQHGHNDVGSFVLYARNVPFLVDPGVGTYVKETFSKNRYKIWSMGASWHNCPAPNGVQQKEGAEHGTSSCTFEKMKKEYVMRSEISGAYTEDAACISYVRTLKLTDSRSKSILVVEDEYELSERRAADEVQFVTPGKVSLLSEGLLTIENEGQVLKVTYPISLVPEIETHKIDDKDLIKHWDRALYAIRFKSASDAPLKGIYTFTFQMR